MGERRLLAITQFSGCLDISMDQQSVAKIANEITAQNADAAAHEEAYENIIGISTGR